MTANDLLLPWTITALIGAVLFVRHRLSPFHPATGYFVFHVLVFCVRPALVGITPDAVTWDLVGVRPAAESIRLALWVSTCALIVVTGVTELTLAGAPKLRPTEFAGFDAADRRALLVTAAMVAGPAVAAFWGTHAGVVDNRHVVDLHHVVLPVALLGILACRWRWWSLAPLVAWTWFAAGLAPSALWHALAVVFAVGLLGLWSRQRTHIPAVWVLVTAGCIAGVLLFDPSAWNPSWRTPGEAPRTGASRTSAVSTRLSEPALAHFEVLAATIDQVATRESAHTAGAQHVSVLTGDAARPPRGQPPARHSANALVADGWLSGGWTGVIATVGLVSLAFAGIARWLRQRPNNPAAGCFACTTLGFALPLYARADLSLLRVLLFTAVPVAVWQLLAARFRRGAAAEQERERLRERREQRRLLGHALLHPQAASLPPEVIHRAETRGDDAMPDDDAEDTSEDEDHPDPESEEGAAAHPESTGPWAATETPGAPATPELTPRSLNPESPATPDASGNDPKGGRGLA